MPIDAIVFDFNGVLVDDEHVHFALFRDVLAEEGIAFTERAYHEEYLGYDDRGCFAEALRRHGRPHDPATVDALVDRKAARYVDAADRGLRIFPGVKACLDAFAANRPIAICSGALRPEIEYGLRRIGALDRVAAIVAAEDTAFGKPDPEGYRLAFERLRALRRPDLSPANCLVIEDSHAGIRAARGAGLRTVGLAHTYEADELRSAEPDAILERLADFTPAWVDRTFGGA